jgi:hypothetical protein
VSLKGKEVGRMDFANGSSVQFLNLGEETISSLSDKLQAALEQIQNFKAELRAIEERVEILEQEQG